MSTNPASSDSDLDPERAELRTALIGLSMACPFSQDNPASCQLCDVRARPIAERLKWIAQLPVADMRAIYATHQQCLHGLERGKK